MTYAKTALTLALSALPALASASAELSFGAEKAFLSAAFGEPLPKPSSAQWAIRMSALRAPSATLFKVSMLGQVDDRGASAAALPVADIELADLLNKQLKGALKYVLGGKEVWVSGAFDRQQNAYVSILVNGSEARFYNVKGLLDKEEAIAAGTAAYKLYLVPNVINQMKSEIILENAADEDDKIRISLKKMLEGTGASGASVAIAGRAYKVFYTDDIKAGQVDKTAKSFTFILAEPSGEIHVFLIPAELVPSDKLAVFNMFENVRVGLQQKDGRLKVHEQP